MTTRGLAVIMGMLVGARSLHSQTPRAPRTTSCADSISHDTTAYTLAELTEPPIVRSGILPQVSQDLLRSGVKLQVLLSFVVGPDGRVEPQSVVVVDSSRTAFTSRITAYERPNHFQDTMVTGPFAAFVHEHHFMEEQGGTTMRDDVEFRSPLGAIGGLVDRLVLRSYLRGLLVRRNLVLKRLAEGPAGGSARPAP